VEGSQGRLDPRPIGTEGKERPRDPGCSSSYQLLSLEMGWVGSLTMGAMPPFNELSGKEVGHVCTYSLDEGNGLASTD